MASDAPRIALAFAPLILLAALIPPLSDAPLPFWTLSLPIFLWLRAAAWIGGRDAAWTGFYLFMGLPLRAWTWSAFGAATWTELAFLALADAATTSLAVLAPTGLGLDARSVLGLLVSLASLAAGAAALALAGPPGSAALLSAFAAFSLWLAARRSA